GVSGAAAGPAGRPARRGARRAGPRPARGHRAGRGTGRLRPDVLRPARRGGSLARLVGPVAQPCRTPAASSGGRPGLDRRVGDHPRRAARAGAAREGRQTMMGPVMMGAVSRRLRALTQDAMRSGNYRTALVHARLAVGTAERSDDPRELDAALFLLACVYSMFQRGAKEAECAERRIALAERLGDELMLASALAQRAEARILGGRPAEGA